MTLGPLIHDARISDSWRFPFLANAKVLHGDVGLSDFVRLRYVFRSFRAGVARCSSRGETWMGFPVIFSARRAMSYHWRKVEPSGSVSGNNTILWRLRRYSISGFNALPFATERKGADVLFFHVACCPDRRQAITR